MGGRHKFMLEKETIELYKKILSETAKRFGVWRHSPVENWKRDYFAKNFNETNLVNFRRTPLCEGTISFPDRPLRIKNQRIDKPWFSGIPFWQKIRGVRDIFLELYQLNSRFKFKLSEVSDDLIGNPCYYRIGGAKVTDLAIRMCFYGKYIVKEFSGKKNINILEIGGGFGGLCWRLFNSPDLSVGKYFFVDLPEMLPLAYWFLNNSGIKTSMILSAADKADGQAAVVAPWMLPKLDFNFDLFINTMSFQHMTKENLDYYFSEIERLNIDNLFLVNRDSVRDPTDLKISDYPISSKYELTKEDEYPFSKHLLKIYSIARR